MCYQCVHSSSLYMATLIGTPGYLQATWAKAQRTQAVKDQKKKMERFLQFVQLLLFYDARCLKKNSAPIKYTPGCSVV